MKRNASLNYLLATTMMMAAAAHDKGILDAVTRSVPSYPTHPRRDLPRWDVNGHVIFAKDAKTAEKYAKKRGLWVPGTIVKPIESK